MPKLKMPNAKEFRLNKIITFVNSNIMDFPDNKFEIKAVIKLSKMSEI